MISLSYSISSLTPIVTGDHDHRNTKLLATGILGSLRYQYWLLKAMEAWQDNPQHPVYPPYSSDKLPVKDQDDSFKKALREAGPVVWLFGATNWKKMFRLEIANAQKTEERSQDCSARSHNRAPYSWKNVNLIFHRDRKESRTINELAEKEGFSLENELRNLMAFVHHYGWLGAAPQNGLGWVTVQGEGLEQISLPENNSVFAAKDIVLNKQQANELRSELISYYRGKGISSRYTQSLNYLEQSHPPIGYEIRRWLRDQMFSPAQYHNNKEQKNFFGTTDHAGFVHVTHPVVQLNDGSWHIRMRFTVRPGESGGINPLAKPSDRLDQCKKLLEKLPK